MSRSEWIVCERSNDWVAALRKVLQRGAATHMTTPRLREVRNLAEAVALLDVRLDRLVLMEVHRENLADALSFLSEAGNRLVLARVATLIDHAIAPGQAGRQMVADALLEAGAEFVADSPRRLGGLLHFAQRHGATRTGNAGVSQCNSLVIEQAWDSLPWQDK